MASRPRSSRSPARIVPLAFLIAIALGTLLLMLPLARAGDGAAPFLTALFTATSAVCVTGLIVVDTATYWSGFGQAVIMLLFQIGGFGVMSGATLLIVLITRRLRLSAQVAAHAETRNLGLGDVLGVLKMAFLLTLAVELTVAVIMTLRLRLGYAESWPDAVWNGVFHAVSAFNNAGFSTYSDSLVGFVDDVWVIVPVALAVIIGGLGLPVIHELLRRRHGTVRWSVHTRMTLLGTLILLLFGFVAILAYEWGNPATLGQMSIADKVIAAGFHSVMPRTAGFNSIDVGAMSQETLAVNYVLMFIGGGSASTAGGIKITTFLLLALVAWAEVRGQPDTNLFRRRIPPLVQRQATAVVLLAVLLIAIATMILLTITRLPLGPVLFEAISAFSTVGLSTGITGELPPTGQIVIIVLMFVGRAGVITVPAALALRTGRVTYRYPEERPNVG